MLRISIDRRPDGAEMILEGRLTGPWVDEVVACWQRLRATCDPRSIRIDLDGVGFVDPGGRMVLEAMHAEGATLAASDVRMRALVDEIAAGGSERHPPRHAGK